MSGTAAVYVKIITDEWADGAAYLSNTERADDLSPFLQHSTERGRWCPGRESNPHDLSAIGF